MASTTRILLFGATGRMGQQLLPLIDADARCELVAGISSRALPASGLLPEQRVSVRDVNDVGEVDVVIDFSRPAGTEAALEFCLRRRCALVSGSTGLDDFHWAAFDSAAQRIPLLWAANFSLGVAVLTELVRRSAAMLHGWDCDLIETHHARKLDAPSGTALHLGQAIESQRGEGPVMHSVRAGDVVGEHVVQFTGAGERLELSHQATDRAVFARGALEAAVRLAGQIPGRYSIGELLL